MGNGEFIEADAEIGGHICLYSHIDRAIEVLQNGIAHVNNGKKHEKLDSHRFSLIFWVPKNPLRQISTNTAIFISNGRSPTSINHDDFPFKVNRKSRIIKAKNPNVCLGRIILVSIPSPPK